MKFHSSFTLLNLKYPFMKLKRILLFVMKKELCPTCNESLKIEKFINEFTVCGKCSHCDKKFTITHEEKTFPANINSFNWGAFILYRIWGLFNGMTLLSLFGWLLASLCELFYPLALFDLTISVYLGIYGNRLSWKRKDWKSITTFEKNQKVWNIVGLVLFILLCIFFVSLIIQTNYFMEDMLDTSDY